MKVFLPDTPSGPVMRTYTVRHFDRERGLVAIDFLLNDGLGPATQWAARVIPGMWLELSGRSRSTFQPEEDGRYLFAGDESALPAIATCLESLPASAQATAIIELEDEGEELPLASDATVDGSWLYRDADGPRLVDAVVGAAVPSAFSLIWVACEAGTMREIRRALLDAGIPAHRLRTRGYWKRGALDHPDHDTGEDVV
jgi:NADPH-dependent ferric siderophore reductase